MRINTFEDMRCWQHAKVLTTEIYQLLKGSRDYGYNDQIQRASVSIMNNIAEGFERKSNKELKQFLFIAKGSCGEVRSMLYLAEELNYMPPAKTKELVRMSLETSRMISALIKTL